MNQLEGRVHTTQSHEGVAEVFIEVQERLFSSLILSHETPYEKQEKITLLFKETEVMLATLDSKVSAQNAFVSKITAIEVGKVLAQVTLEFCATEINAIITKSALENLECCVGDMFIWFVQSNEITLQKG